MNTQFPNTQTFDFAPAMKLFADNLETWKQNYDQILKSSNITPAIPGSELLAKPAELAISNWQAAGEALFKSFVEQQAELCRFFGKRWELYRDFPRRLSGCKTPADLAEVETEFLKKMAEDYSSESAKLAKPMNDLMAAWAGGRFGTR